MNNITKRHILFIFGCIPVRLLLVYVAKTINTRHLPILGLLALIPSFGFFILYVTNKRKTGIETFGERIWWHELRIIHALLYLLFSVWAIKQKTMAYIPLLLDVVIGGISFMIYHHGCKHVL